MLVGDETGHVEYHNGAKKANARASQWALSQSVPRWGGERCTDRRIDVVDVNVHLRAIEAGRLI